jgi:ubiquinone biosynthesis protein COQ9
MTEMHPETEALRDRVLAAALPHVPFDGWTMTALKAGATAAGLPAIDAMRAFPGGALDAIEHHSMRADRQMVEALGAMDLSAMRTRDRIAAAIRLRLEQSAGDREAIRRALTILGMPQNGWRGARLLYRTVDAIWYACGDTATDFNFYTKRGLLAGVYSATLLYWLNDKSDDLAETWRFLDRRIDDVMRIGKAQARVGQLLDHLPNPLRLRPSTFLRPPPPRWR